MSVNRALWIILIIGIGGLLFSGYLSTIELFMTPETESGGIVNGVIQPCPALAEGTAFSLPACVYGFFMYLVIVIVSAMGIRAKA